MASADLLPHIDFHDTGRPVTGLPVDYPDGASTGWHAHPTAQLLYAIEGMMQVNTRNGVWLVPPTCAVWLSAGTEHDVRMSGRVKLRTVYVDVRLVSDLPDASRVVRISPLLRELIVAATALPRVIAENSRDSKLLSLLLDELRRSPEQPLHLPLPTGERTRALCLALITHPADTATAAQLAARFHITARTLHRAFAQEIGLSFSQWRRQARLLHAINRLADGARIIDVAFDCGYSSQSAFTAMFRRHFGYPPSQALRL